MKKTDLSSFAFRMRHDVAKYSPQILMGFGIVGMVGTTVLAVKATPKAIQLIDVEKRNRRSEHYNEEVKEWCGDPMTVVDTIKVAWKPYLPSMVLGTVSLICIVGSNSVSTRRTAAIATAYKISETALREYRDKVIETIGEKKEKVVREKIAEEHIKNNPVANNQVIVTKKGETFCYDCWSGRYFKSDIELIRKAENKLNRDMMMDMSGYISLNEFYNEIGLESTKTGNILGWSIDDGLFKVEFHSMIADDGNPCLVIDFDNPPKYDYSKIGY